MKEYFAKKFNEVHELCFLLLVVRVVLQVATDMTLSYKRPLVSEQTMDGDRKELADG